MLAGRRRLRCCSTISRGVEGELLGIIRLVEWLAHSNDWRMANRRQDELLRKWKAVFPRPRVVVAVRNCGSALTALVSVTTTDARSTSLRLNGAESRLVLETSRNARIFRERPRGDERSEWGAILRRSRRNLELAHW
jgi:hypothetical protein